MLDLSDTIASDAFAQRARHPDASGAFGRTRRPPLPALVSLLLCMRASSQQAMLDSFFGSLFGDGALVRALSAVDSATLMRSVQACSQAGQPQVDSLIQWNPRSVNARVLRDRLYAGPAMA